MFFDPKRYDLAHVGRYKVNKKLAFASRIVGCMPAEPVIDPESGEVLAGTGDVITREIAEEIDASAVNRVVVRIDDNPVVVFSNHNFDITRKVSVDLSELHITERVYLPVLEELMEQAQDDEELKSLIKRNLDRLVPKHLTLEDIMASIDSLLNLQFGLGNLDDIDHLGNRRLRCVGELLQNQFRVGFARMERVVKELSLIHIL